MHERYTTPLLLLLQRDADPGRWI